MAKKAKAKETPPPAPPPIDRYAWQKQMASEMGVIVETMREWSRRPGFPDLGTLDQIVAWHRAHIRPGGPPTKGQRERAYDPLSEESQNELLEAKAKSVLLKNEKIQEDIIAKRLANEIKKRNLISLPAVESFLRKWISKERSEMEGWPSEVVTALPGRDRQSANDILSEKVRLKLIRLAALEHELFADEEVMGNGAK